MMGNRLPIALVLSMVAISATASAHGGVPISTNAFFPQKNGQTREYIETTFGLLTHEDNGEWRLTCEETLETGLKIFKVWPDGEVGMGYAEGYAWTDDGCYYHQATGVSSSARTLATADLGPSGKPTLVLLTDLAENQDFGTNLYTSSDRGRTFQNVHLPKGTNIISMAVPTAGPTAIVLTTQTVNAPAGGADGGTKDSGDSSTVTNWLLTSTACLTNAACTDDDWTQIQLDPTVFGQGITRVLAVEPEGLFVRHVVNEDSQVYLSTDGGHTFKQVLPTADIPLPNPVDFVTRTGPNEFWASAGLRETFHSTDGGNTWTVEPDLGDVRCAVSNGNELHQCVVDFDTNDVARVSTDHGKTWKSDLRYDQVAGIKTCPADSDVAMACNDLWLIVKISFLGQQSTPPTQPTPTKHGCSSTELGPLGLVAFWFVNRRVRAKRVD